MSEDQHHFIPFKVYLNVFLGLLFLTVVTVAVAKPVSGFDATGFFSVSTQSAVNPNDPSVGIISVIKELSYNSAPTCDVPGIDKVSIVKKCNCV